MLNLRAGALLATILIAASVANAQQPTGQPAAGARRDTNRTIADTTRRDTARAAAAMAPVPAADQALGIDAEIRVALYELLNDRPLPALARLQYLSQSPTAMSTPPAQERALRGREDLLFLLAQGYYRYGMDSSFRAIAQNLIAGGTATRYAPLLRGQLLLEAYRSGDVARVVDLARALEQTEARGLAGVVHGLAHYQQGRWSEARTALAPAMQSGPPYATYAAYMDALAQMRGDTAQTAAGLAALQQLAQSASGELADQIRLTAAQIAYEQGRHPEAAALAGQVSDGSGLGAQALLTRAWALYKSNDLSAAGDAFARFASTYGDLPERDESRVMHGQVLLQLGKTEEAGTLFRATLDSLNGEATSLEQQARLATNDAATALVRARAAGLLFLSDPAIGKTVALEDAAGSERAVIAVVTDSPTTAPSVKVPEIITVADVRQRIGTVQNLPATLQPRVFYAPASATGNRQMYASRAQNLYDADVALAIAQFRMQELQLAYQRRLALVEQLRTQLATFADSLGRLATTLTAAADSLARVGVALDATRLRLRNMFAGQINATRLLADENIAYVDSLRRSVAGSMGPDEDSILTLEKATAVAYRSIADQTERGFDGAMSRHPTFAMYDSLRAKNQYAQGLLAQAQSSLSGARAALDAEIARLRGQDPTVGPVRTALDAAAARRTAAEQRLIAVVRGELDARVNEMVAELKRDAEAAQFGAASATFFKALDAQRATTATGATGGAGATEGSAGATPAPGTTTNPAGAPNGQRRE